RQAELDRALAEDAARPLSLTSAPLLRVFIYRLADDEHVLTLAVHHIAFDAWSDGVLRTELGALYAAFRRGARASLPEPALLAAFQALLHRYSGQDSVLVGTPVANRGSVELEPLIGFFTNTLVMRADLTTATTGTELLQQVRDRSLAAFAHQNLPFERLVEEL